MSPSRDGGWHNACGVPPPGHPIHDGGLRPPSQHRWVDAAVVFGAGKSIQEHPKGTVCVAQHVCAMPPSPGTSRSHHACTVYRELRMSSVVVEVLWDHPETTSQPPEPARTVFLGKNNGGTWRKPISGVAQAGRCSAAIRMIPPPTLAGLSHPTDAPPAVSRCRRAKEAGSWQGADNEMKNMRLETLQLLDKATTHRRRCQMSPGQEARASSPRGHRSAPAPAATAGGKGGEWVGCKNTSAPGILQLASKKI